MAVSGLTCRNRKGPKARNTTTSAATDSDHRMLPIPALMPAAFQLIIANESCIAWLPRISAATMTNRRKAATRIRSNTPNSGFLVGA